MEKSPSESMESLLHGSLVTTMMRQKDHRPKLAWIVEKWPLLLIAGFSLYTAILSSVSVLASVKTKPDIPYSMWEAQ